MKTWYGIFKLKQKDYEEDVIITLDGVTKPSQAVSAIQNRIKDGNIVADNGSLVILPEVVSMDIVKSVDVIKLTTKQVTVTNLESITLPDENETRKS